MHRVLHRKLPVEIPEVEQEKVSCVSAEAPGAETESPALNWLGLRATLLSGAWWRSEGTRIDGTGAPPPQLLVVSSEGHSCPSGRRPPDALRALSPGADVVDASVGGSSRGSSTRTSMPIPEDLARPSCDGRDVRAAQAEDVSERAALAAASRERADVPEVSRRAHLHARRWLDQGQPRIAA